MIIKNEVKVVGYVKEIGSINRIDGLYTRIVLDVKGIDIQVYAKGNDGKLKRIKVGDLVQCYGVENEINVVSNAYAFLNYNDFNR